MTDLAAQPSAADTPTDAAFSAPDALLHLALQAIRHGAHKVSLIHEGGATGLPIGWLLWITHQDPFLDPEAAGPDLISMQVGTDPNSLQAPHWLAVSVAVGSSNVAVSDPLVEMFEAGARNGWDVIYDRKEFDNQTFARVLERNGNHTFVPSHELRAHATNWAYDAATAATGARAATAVTMILQLGSADEALAFTDDSGVFAQIPADDASDLLRSTAPYSVPLARFDDQLGEWVK